MADALLEDLESVLSVLVVEGGEVRDTTDTGQDSLILGERVPGTEGSDHGDALTAAKGLKGLMLDVTALHDNSSSLDGTADHLGAAVGEPQGSLATDHAFAVGKHGDNYEGVRVVVPGHGGGVGLLPGHVLHVGVLDTVLASVVDGNVDVANIKVNGRDQLSAGNSGDLGKNFGGLPGGVGERGSAMPWSARGCMHMQSSDGDLLGTHATDHVLNEARSVLALTHNLLAKYLGTHLLDGLGCEELKRLADSVGSNALTLEADLGHCVDTLGRLVVEVLLSIEGFPDSLGGLVDKELGDWVARTGSSLGLGGNGLWGLLDLGGNVNESRHCDWWCVR